MSRATELTKAWYERHGAKRYLKGRNPYFLDYHLQVFADYFKRELPEDGSILDVGAAGAFRYPALKQFLPHCHYESCDIAQSFVNMAREKYPHLNHFECNIADKDTLPHRQYHGILCLSVLQHVSEEEIQYATCNIYQLLRSEGLALISLPTAHIGGYKGDTRHFTIMSAEKQRELLQNAGFKIRTEDTTKGFKSADGWHIYLVQRT